jgi:hypothetical protein
MRFPICRASSFGLSRSPRGTLGIIDKNWPGLGVVTTVFATGKVKVQLWFKTLRGGFFLKTL